MQSWCSWITCWGTNTSRQQELSFSLNFVLFSSKLLPNARQQCNFAHNMVWNNFQMCDQMNKSPKDTHLELISPSISFALMVILPLVIDTSHSELLLLLLVIDRCVINIKHLYFPFYCYNEKQIAIKNQSNQTNICMNCSGETHQTHQHCIALKLQFQTLQSWRIQRHANVMPGNHEITRLIM